MSRPVDEKIVRMKLENSDFQRKAGETVGIFSKITNALNKIPGVNLGKTTSELGNIGNAANGIQTDKLASGIENISSKFSLLGIAGVAAIASISSQLTGMATNLVKSFTGIQGMTDGFGEYETKIGSIQTILTNTAKHGTTLKDVNAQLENLNEYSDKTIYNFADMTKNIGLFTTSGLELDTSVTAIKGLSNWAAASGASASQASNSMYQLSQSLSSGVVRLQDWKSVENSNMGGAIFRDALLDTAKNMGKVVDMSEGFNYSLEQNWLTTDVLMSVLDDFSKREDFIEAATKVRTFTQMIDTSKEAIGSGWAKTWELIFGDFEGATRLWTGINNVIGGFIQRSADARNSLVKLIVDGGGLKALGRIFTNTFGSIGKVLGAIGKAFRDVFPKGDGSGILRAIKDFAGLTDSLKISDKSIAFVRDTFASLFTTIKNGIDKVKGFAKGLKDLIPDDLAAKAQANAIEFGNFAGAIIDAAATSSTFSEFSTKVGGSFDKMYRYIEPTMTAISDWFGPKLDKIKASIKSFKLPTFTNPLSKTTGDGEISGFLSETATQMWSFTEVMGKISAKLKEYGGAIKNFFSGMGMEELIAGGFTVTLGIFLKRISDAMKTFSDPKYLTSIVKTFQTLGKDIGGALEAFQTKVKFDAILKIAGALLVLAVSLKIMETIEVDDIVKGLVALTASLGVMLGAIKILEKTDMSLFNGGKITSMIIGMGISIAIIAGALKKISALKPEQLQAGVMAIGTLMLLLAGTMKILKDSTTGADVVGDDSSKILLQMAGLGVIITLVASAVGRLSKIDGNKLMNGTLAVTAILGALVGAFILLGKFPLPNLVAMEAFSKFSRGLATSAAAIALFTFSISLLVKAVEAMGEIKIEVLTQGLRGMATLLAQVAVFQLISGGTGTLSAGLGLAVVAASIGLMIPPLTVLGTMDLDVLTQGLTAMGITVLTLGLALAIAKDGFTGAVGIAVVAVSMMLLVPVIKILGEMDMVSLAKGVLTIAYSLTFLAIALNAAKDTQTGALALIVGAVAINMLVIPIAALAALPILGVVTALIAIAGVFAIMGAASYALELAVPTMVALAGAITLLGLAVFLGGAGLTLFAAGLTALVGIAALSATAIIKSFGILLDGFAGLAPKIGAVLVSLFATFIDIIIGVAPELGRLAVFLVVSLIAGLITGMPIIISGAVLLVIVLIESLTSALQKYGPRLIAATLQLMGEIVTIIVQALAAVLDVFLGWIPGMSANLKSKSAEASDAIRDAFDGESLGVDMTEDLDVGIFKTAPKVKKTSENMGKEAVKGFGKSIESGQDDVFDSSKTVAESAEEGFETTDGSKGAQLGIDGFTGTIKDMLPDVDLAALGIPDTFEGAVETTDGTKGGKKAVETFTDSMGNQIPKLQTKSEEVVKTVEGEVGKVDNTGAGKSAVVTLASGISQHEALARIAAKKAAQQAANGAAEVSLYNTGTNLVKGMASGMSDSAWRVRQQALNIANAARVSVNTHLEIQSPSRVMMKIGQFFTEGFANGIGNRVSKVGQVATKMTNQALDAVNGFIDTFANTFQEEDAGMDFKLRPVVDLDSLEKVPNQSYGLSADTSGLNKLTNVIDGRFGQNGNRLNQEASSTITGDTNNVTYEINISATGDLPRTTIKKMADAIQTEIKNASDRAKMNRGEVVYY